MSEIDDKTIDDIDTVAKIRTDGGYTGSFFLNDEIISLIARARSSEAALTTALRRAEEAEAIANRAMAEGLLAVERAKRLHVYDADGKVFTQAAVNRLLHERATHAGIIDLLRTIVDEAIELQPVCTSPIDLLTMLEHEVHEQRIRRHRTERERDEAEAIANLAMSEGLDFSLKYVWLRTPRPLDEWHEDNGPALWWTLPVSEPPYAGTLLDDDFPEHVTHWTPLEIPFGGERSDYCPGPSAAVPLHIVIAADAGGSDA